MMLLNIFGWYLLLGLGVMRRDQITITYELFLLHQLRYGLSRRNMSQMMLRPVTNRRRNLALTCQLRLLVMILAEFIRLLVMILAEFMSQSGSDRKRPSLKRII